MNCTREQKWFAEHVLTKTGPKTWRFSRPNTRVFRGEFWESDFGLVISGDFSFDKSGDCAGGITLRYKTMEWFCGKLSADYLASKGLERFFSAKGTAEDIREWLANVEDYEIDERAAEELGDIAQELEEGSLESAHELWNQIPGWLMSHFDDGFSVAYDKGELALLVALQQSVAAQWPIMTGVQ